MTLIISPVSHLFSAFQPMLVSAISVCLYTNKEWEEGGERCQPSLKDMKVGPFWALFQLVSKLKSSLFFCFLEKMVQPFYHFD